MSSPRERIESEIRQALKAGDKLRLSTLRMLLTAIQNESIRITKDVDEAAFLTLVRRGIKERKESAEQYIQGNRPELAEKEEAEAEILASYLPPAISEEDLVAAIREIVEREQLSGPAGIGPVMKEMMSRFGAAADGATISRIARQILTES